MGQHMDISDSDQGTEVLRHHGKDLCGFPEQERGEVAGHHRYKSMPNGLPPLEGRGLGVSLQLLKRFATNRVA